MDVQATTIGRQSHRQMKEVEASENFGVKLVNEVGNFLRELAQLVQLTKTCFCESITRIVLNRVSVFCFYCILLRITTYDVINGFSLVPFTYLVILL